MGNWSPTTDDYADGIPDEDYGDAIDSALTTIASGVPLLGGLQVNGDHDVSQVFVDTAYAGLTAAGGLFTDSWGVTCVGAVVVTVQRGQTTPPAGLSNYLRTTVTTVDSAIASGDFLLIRQPIEGYRVARLGWGAAGAKSITGGFWVRCSITGTFGLSVTNGSFNRSYITTFTITQANTWEWKTFTIPGDTSGTWQKTTLNGLEVRWCLSAGSTYQGTAGAWSGSNLLTTSSQTNFSGTNGATFDITGFRLLEGDKTLSSDVVASLARPLGEELAICQRYYQKSYNHDVVPGTGTLVGGVRLEVATTTAPLYTPARFPVPMRATPTVTLYDDAGTSGKVYKGASGKTGVVADAGMNGFAGGTGDTTNAAILFYHFVADARIP